MDLHAETEFPTIYDRVLQRIQRHLTNRIKIPFEIRLWGEHAYRFG